MQVRMVELVECQDDLEETVCGRHLSAYPPNADPKLLYRNIGQIFCI